MEQLPEHACWEALRSAEVGRLAVVVEDHPEIFPVNFVVDHGTVVFRSAEGSKVDAALSGRALAFEADGVSNGQAWSVMVKGFAEWPHDVDDAVAAAALPLFPWQAGEKNRFVRVVPTEVSGRRFAVRTAD
ncbi:hypothetical protein GCM10011512_08730 [Tersicoccus solisilvae]|uniref:Flavin-nucleotide-binding protein n=1 Tax=Tersicoccus solisilvae TaxID=1882339 RepID=A0ABQ1NS73_9MICC|nr:hypothetical protein GCM10011512_08730 [Tersicoccus solisilvae]